MRARAEAWRARRRAHRVRADDGLPARRPRLAARGGAPPRRRPGAVDLRQPDAVRRRRRISRATRAISRATSPRRARAGVDVAFVPERRDDVPARLPDLRRGARAASRACAARSRPGHFAASPPSCSSCSTSCSPHVALFGEKDYQQLAVIRRMARDLDLGVEIVGMPIVREPDGLAMSSRNAYLSPDERLRALALSRALVAARERLRRRRARRRRASSTARARRCT